MAQTPKFNTPKTSPPASGWQPGHRAPALGYGQLDGNCTDGESTISPIERDAFPDCDPEGY